MKSVVSTFLLLFILLASFPANAQTKHLIGKVINGANSRPLTYANLRVLKSNIFASTNSEGFFELLLAGTDEVKITATYVGFVSDTIEVKSKNLSDTLQITLFPGVINFPEITVFAGDNPADEIIRLAIKRKKAREGLLDSYSYEGYSKIIVKSKGDLNLQSSGGGVSMGINSENDTLPYKIAGILENKSLAFYKKPSNYKENILARKQTANFPSSINFLTGGRFIQNFYSDDVEFFNRNITSPLSDDAVSFYRFKLIDFIPLDGKTLFHISMTPKNPYSPGFEGDIYIMDKTYDLVKVDLTINSAANTGGMFETVNLSQQYFPFGANEVYMPVDYHLSAKMNIMNLVQFAFSLNASLNNYNLSPNFAENFFDKVVIKVNSDADKKDSIYWANIQKIPTSIEEGTAYTRIDSVTNAPRSIWSNFSLMSTTFSISDNIAITAPLGLYSFDRVAGHSINYSIRGSKLFDDRMGFYLGSSYGFSDKYFKKSFNGNIRLGEYRTTNIRFNFFDDQYRLFGENSYSSLFETIASLGFKYDYVDYYYAKGFAINASTDVTSILSMNVGFKNSTENSAITNNDESIFNKEKATRQNRPITEGRINQVGAGFRFDFRNFIEDGFYRRRITDRKMNIYISGSVDYSSKDLLKSDFDYTVYKLNLNGDFKTAANYPFNYSFEAFWADGTMPYQSMKSLAGNIEGVSRSYSFRTIGYNEFVGNKVVTLFLNQSLGDDFFSKLHFPLLEKLPITINLFFNAAYLDNTSGNRTFLNGELPTLKNPFAEAGFSLGAGVYPLQLDFAWRLTHQIDNNFKIGVSTAILF